MHIEAADSWSYKNETYNSTYAGLFRWREAFQNDFAARMDWSITDSYEKANHNPIAAFANDKSLEYINLHVKVGDKVELSAAGTSDPDGDKVSYRWFHYKEAGNTPYGGNITIKNSNSSDAGFVMPELRNNQKIHIILEVKDIGSPALYSYRRIIVR